MGLKRINLDITTITEGAICHQVNCRGVMGAGLARRIRNKFPSVYSAYRKHHRTLRVGMIQPVRITDKLYVVNVAGQDGFGRDRIYTDYDGLRLALRKLNAWAKERQVQVHIPVGMGCNLAGGNWVTVSRIIAEEVPDAILCNYQQS